MSIIVAVILLYHRYKPIEHICNFLSFPQNERFLVTDLQDNVQIDDN
jgi:hypothetical protein